MKTREEIRQAILEKLAYSKLCGPAIVPSAANTVMAQLAADNIMADLDRAIVVLDEYRAGLRTAPEALDCLRGMA